MCGKFAIDQTRQVVVVGVLRGIIVHKTVHSRFTIVSQGSKTTAPESMISYQANHYKGDKREVKYAAARTTEWTIRMLARRKLDLSLDVGRRLDVFGVLVVNVGHHLVVVSCRGHDCVLRKLKPFTQAATISALKLERCRWPVIRQSCWHVDWPSFLTSAQQPLSVRDSAAHMAHNNLKSNRVYIYVLILPWYWYPTQEKYWTTVIQTVYWY